MTAAGPPPAGDRARVQVRVDVAPAEAFRIFVEDIDAWWRRGRAYRVAATGDGTLHVEPGVGGRMVETYASSDGVASGARPNSRRTRGAPSAGHSSRGSLRGRGASR